MAAPPQPASSLHPLESRGHPPCITLKTALRAVVLGFGNEGAKEADYRSDSRPALCSCCLLSLSKLPSWQPCWTPLVCELCRQPRFQSFL
jgi:hypothetical protein